MQQTTMFLPFKQIYAGLSLSVKQNNTVIQDRKWTKNGQ